MQTLLRIFHFAVLHLEDSRRAFFTGTWEVGFRVHKHGKPDGFLGQYFS